MSVKWINQLLIIFIEKWPGEITRAIAQEENCIGDDFLRVACTCQSSERIYIYICVCMYVDTCVRVAPAVLATCMLRTMTKAALYGPVR